MGVPHFRCCGGTQQRYAHAQNRNLVVVERAPRFDRGKQNLLDRASNLTGSDKAQGRTDAA